jgi:hypothetical protein
MLNNHPHRSATLAPGQAAPLRVTFDANDHGPEGLRLQPKAGRITTGDLRQPLAETRFTATGVEMPEAWPSRPTQLAGALC